MVPKVKQNTIFDVLWNKMNKRSYSAI